MGLPRGLALVLLEYHGAGIGTKGSGSGFTNMPQVLSLTSFLGYLITRLHAIVQLDCRVACNYAMGWFPKVVFRLLDCVQSCSSFGFWGFVEMALVMMNTCLCNKSERRPQPVCNKYSASMHGNRHKATAQRIPNGET